jgi:flagellar M-ring protein FliF
MVTKLSTLTPTVARSVEDDDAIVNLSEQAPGESAEVVVPPTSYEQGLDAAKQMAKDNPRMVASVISGWTSGEES